VHGALGAIYRDVSTEALFDAVRAVARGESRCAAADAESSNGVADVLSVRERLVARLVGEGRSNKELASAMGISELTAKKHVGNILRKLGLHDRLQLGLCVARHRLSFESD